MVIRYVKLSPLLLTLRRISMPYVNSYITTFRSTAMSNLRSFCIISRTVAMHNPKILQPVFAYNADTSRWSVKIRSDR